MEKEMEQEKDMIHFIIRHMKVIIQMEKKVEMENYITKKEN